MMATVYGIPFLDSSEINNIKEYNQIRHADYKLIIAPWAALSTVKKIRYSDYE